MVKAFRIYYLPESDPGFLALVSTGDPRNFIQQFAGMTERGKSEPTECGIDVNQPTPGCLQEDAESAGNNKAALSRNRHAGPFIHQQQICTYCFRQQNGSTLSRIELMQGRISRALEFALGADLHPVGRFAEKSSHSFGRCRVGQFLKYRGWYQNAVVQDGQDVLAFDPDQIVER